MYIGENCLQFQCGVESADQSEDSGSFGCSLPGNCNMQRVGEDSCLLFLLLYNRACSLIIFVLGSVMN